MSDVNITVTDGTTPTTITVFDGVFVDGGGAGAVASVNGKVGVVVLGASDVGAVPTTRTVAGKALSADVTLAKSDVGLGSVDNTADAAKAVLSASKLTTARTINGVSFDGTTAITVADSTKVPTTRTVNGHPLSADVTVDYSELTGKPTLGTAAAKDIPASGNASSTQVVYGSDTRLSDSRPPSAHAASHASAGSDPITIAESQVTNLTSDLAAKAPLASPTFTGTPAAPTATAGTNTTQVATTAFVTAAVVGAGGYVDPLTTKGDIVARSASATVRKAVGSNGAALFADSAQTDGLNWRAIAESDVTNLTTDLAAKAPTASPTFTGTVTIPTATAADSSTKAASTAYVQGELTAKAPLASPTFTGTPAVPTASAGTNTTQAASTAFVKAALDKQAEWTTIALSDESTAITTGTAKVTWRAPMPLTLTGVRASVSTASSSGLPTVDIKKNGTTVLSTLLTIDATEKTSVTAATAAVISVTSVSDDDEITFDVTVAGTGTKGLKVTLYWTRA